MWTAEVVLVCALNMLGRSAASFPPIQLVQTVPARVSPTAEAFVRRGDPHIYLITSSGAFRDAEASMDRCGNPMAIRKIASILIHEEAHLRHGADEKAAYQAQLTILTALGAGPGSPPYSQVSKAMRVTLNAQRKARAAMIASAK
jgi:hypothetical protein